MQDTPMASKNPGDSTFDLDPQTEADKAQAALAASHAPVAEPVVTDEVTEAPKRRRKTIAETLAEPTPAEEPATLIEGLQAVAAATDE
jgi:hypothetical protein